MKITCWNCKKEYELDAAAVDAALKALDASKLGFVDVPCPHCEKENRTKRAEFETAKLAFEEAAKKAAEEAAKTGNNPQGPGQGNGGNSIYNPNNPSVPRGKGKAKGNPHVSPS